MFYSHCLCSLSARNDKTSKFPSDLLVSIFQVQDGDKLAFLGIYLSYTKERIYSR